MDESPAPRPRPGPGPVVPEPSGTSRRWFLAGGAAVLLGGGAGVGIEYGIRSGRTLPAAPPELVVAAETERSLIASLDATTGGVPDVRKVITAARADHAAHLAALEALLARYRRPPSATPSARPSAAARTKAQLRTAEQAAATAAASRASALSGAHAALLASISACEATHAELLR